MLEAKKFCLQGIDEDDLPRVVEAYGLLQEALGTDAVEDVSSFRRTVSASTDAFVVPRVVCALYEGEMVGVTVGAALKNVGMGFIAYSAVGDGWRQKGVYGAMRQRLIAELCAVGEIGGVLSELEGDGWLYQMYLSKFGAVALPCDYEQPQVQGLHARALNLVAQPITDRLSLDGDDVGAIVSEIYRGIYRIADVEGDASYQRVVASVRSGALASSAD